MMNEAKQQNFDERLFSHSAEAAVIGSMIIEPGCIDKVTAIIGPDSFGYPEHKIIFQAILDLREAGTGIDGAILRNYLEENKTLEKIGGVDYLGKILNNVPTSANAEYYAKIVKDKAQRRRLVGAVDDMKKVLDSDRPVGESIAQIKSMADGLDGAVSNYGNQLVTVNIADVEPQAVQWFWDNRFARGKINSLMGDPGTYKTFFACYMAAKTTTGGKWPDMNGSPDNFAPKGSVILLTGEDGLADTIRPRLDAMGADARKVTVIEGVKIRNGEGRPVISGFCVAYNLPELQKLVDEIGDVVLLILDPVSAFLGDIDTHRDSDVRAVLAPLAAFAEKNNICVLLIRHLNKDSNKKPVYRDSGSLAFMAASRVSWLISTDPDNRESKRRLLTPVKNNILIDPTGLAFEVKDGRIIFENEQIHTTADECLNQGSTVESPVLDKAVEWLQSVLTPGKSMASTELSERAKEQGIKKSALRRAKKQAGVSSFQSLVNGKNQWFCRIGE